ncbi:MAG: DUF948 domain-containing protein, partial [Coleofasciculus sp. S288]|nr:DUF948 domain-containing protein [Coleofasciculus sp. S288]
SDLTDDISEGVQSAGQVVKQVDQSVSGVKNQAKNVQANTRSVVAGVKAAWKTWNRPSAGRRSIDRLPPSQRTALEFSDRETSAPLTSSSSAEHEHRERDANYPDNEPSASETSYQNLQRDSYSPIPQDDLDLTDENSDY